VNAPKNHHFGVRDLTMRKPIGYNRRTLLLMTKARILLELFLFNSLGLLARKNIYWPLPALSKIMVNTAI